MIHNSVALLPLLMGLVTSTVSGRVTLLWARGGAFDEIEARRHIVWSVIGALAFPAQLILFVSAFFIVWWPVAIALLLFCGVFLGLMVTRNTLAPLTGMQPMLSLITVIAAAIVVWILVV